MEIIPKIYDTIDADGVYCSPSPCDRYLLYHDHQYKTTMICYDMHNKNKAWSLSQVDNAKSTVEWITINGVLHIHISEICGHKHRVYNAQTGELFTSFTTASERNCLYFEKMGVWINDVEVPSPSIHIYDKRGQFLRDVSKSHLPLLREEMTWHITLLVDTTTSEGVGGMGVFFTNFQTNEYLKCDISGEKVEVVPTPELSSFIQLHSSQIIDAFVDLSSHITFTMKDDYVVMLYNINTNVVHTIRWPIPGMITFVGIVGNTYMLDTDKELLFWKLDDVGGERTTPDFIINDFLGLRLSTMSQSITNRYIRRNPRTKKIEVFDLLGFKQLIALAGFCARTTSEVKTSEVMTSASEETPLYRKKAPFMIRDIIFFFTRNALAQTRFKTSPPPKRGEKRKMKM